MAPLGLSSIDSANLSDFLKRNRYVALFAQSRSLTSSECVLRRDVFTHDVNLVIVGTGTCLMTIAALPAGKPVTSSNTERATLRLEVYRITVDDFPPVHWFIRGPESIPSGTTLTQTVTVSRRRPRNPCHNESRNVVPNVDIVHTGTLHVMTHTQPSTESTTSTSPSITYGYARVSTNDQQDSLRTQTEALLAAGCDRVASEIISGTVSGQHRPTLRQVLDSLRPNDTLMVCALDRMSRNLGDLLQLEEHLRSRGVRIRSMRETLDSGTPAGRLLLSVMGTVAAYERDILVDRTPTGLAASRARGVRLGRPPVMTAARSRTARALLQAGGASVSETAKEIGVGRSSLYRWARQEGLL